MVIGVKASARDAGARPEPRTTLSVGERPDACEYGISPVSKAIASKSSARAAARPFLITI